MKYSEFEDWMIGEKVEDKYGDQGVVTRSFEDGTDRVWVLWETPGFASGDELWCMVSELTFLETQDFDRESIPWEVGQDVWDFCYGRGEVVNITESDYPVIVQFLTGKVISYTLQGKEAYDSNRTLFFTKPTIIADTIPPKKKFVPTLKEGDEVVVRAFSGGVSAHTVEKECEEYIKFKDEDSVLYKKRIVSINKFGDLIKVDGVNY